jgi:hypothetical protein
LCWWLKQKGNFFLRKLIIIKLSSALSPSNLLLLHTYCSLRRSHFSLSMAGEADQNPPVTTEPAAGGSKSDCGMEAMLWQLLLF